MTLSMEALMERIRHALSEESRLRADVVRTPTPSKMRQYLAAQESCVGLAEELREQLSLSASLSETLAARLRSWSSLVLPPTGDDDDQVWLDALRDGMRSNRFEIGSPKPVHRIRIFLKSAQQIQQRVTVARR